MAAWAAAISVVSALLKQVAAAAWFCWSVATVAFAASSFAWIAAAALWSFAVVVKAVWYAVPACSAAVMASLNVGVGVGGVVLISF